MSGSYAGGKKAEKTNKERYGKDWYSKIGRIGGSNGSTGGFYGDSERATRAGAFGGKISIRGCKLIKKVGNQYTYKDNKTGKTVTRTIPDELLALKSSLKTAKSA